MELFNRMKVSLFGDQFLDGHVTDLVLDVVDQFLHQIDGLIGDFVARLRLASAARGEGEEQDKIREGRGGAWKRQDKQLGKPNLATLKHTDTRNTNVWILSSSSGHKLGRALPSGILSNIIVVVEISPFSMVLRPVAKRAFHRGSSSCCGHGNLAGVLFQKLYPTQPSLFI